MRGGLCLPCAALSESCDELNSGQPRRPVSACVVAGQSGHPSPAGQGQRATLILRPSVEFPMEWGGANLRGFFALLPCFLSAFSPKSSKKSAFYGAIPCLPRAGANEKNKHPSGGYFSPLIPPPPAFLAYGGKSALDGAGAPRRGAGGTLPTPHNRRQSTAFRV